MKVKPPESFLSPSDVFSEKFLRQTCRDALSVCVRLRHCGIDRTKFPEPTMVGADSFVDRRVLCEIINYQALSQEKINRKINYRQSYKMRHNGKKHQQ